MKKFLLFFLCLNSLAFSNAIEEKIYSIPAKDRKFLYYFFNEFVFYNAMGYVFLGDKPAALLTHTLNNPIKNCYYNQQANNLSIKSWSIWKKYEHLFYHPNYIFTEEVRYQGVVKVREILFINKNSLFRIVKKNECLFIQKLGEAFSTEEFVKQVEDKKCLFSLIKEDDELLGIILGFGEESSHQFVKCHEKLVGYYSSGNKKIIGDVVFMGLPDSNQAHELIDKYRQQQEQLCVLYRKKDLLKLTISLLCGNS